MKSHLFSLLVLFVWIHLVLADDPPRCETVNVQTSRTLLDAPMKQFFYASSDHRDAYILSEAGTVYRTTDYGVTWTNMMSRFDQWNNASIIWPQGHSGVKRIHGSGTDHVAYFEGFGLAYWVTRGEEVNPEYKLYTLGQVVNGKVQGDFLTDMIAHPTEFRYVMRLVYDAVCFDQEVDECFKSTQISGYQGHPATWQTVNNYTFQASWGPSSDRVYLTTMPENLRVPDQFNVNARDPGHELLIFEEYGDTLIRTIPSVLTFTFVNNDLYFAKAKDGAYTTYVSHDINSATEMSFNGGHNYTGVTYEIMPSAYDVSFVAVRTSANNAYATLFQSPIDTASYWMSMPFIRMTPGEGADFYATKDLEGIFLANGYGVADLEDDLNAHVQSRISYDKGGMWHPVYDENNSSVALFITPEYTDQPALSYETAAGIVYALGSNGKYRTTSLGGDEIGLYLSRTGGYRWERVLDGRHYFSFSKYAALVVAAEATDDVNTVKFSWDQGASWNSCAWDQMSSFIPTEMLFVSNSDTHFLLIGQYGSGQGAVLSLDFVDAVPRWCEESDLELFEPSVGGACLLGQSHSYTRRQREAQCAVHDYQASTSVNTHACGCTRTDYQCDGECFEERHVEGQASTVCVKIDSEHCNGVNDPTLPPANCHGSYLQTQGYRRVPGDQCEGGDANMYEPVRLPCSVVEPSATLSVSPSPAPSSSVAVTVSPPPSTSVSPPSASASLTSKPPTETPSPTVSIKGPVDASPTNSPVPSPSEGVSPSVASSTSASQTIAPPKSLSRTPSPSMTLKGTISGSVAANTTQEETDTGGNNTAWIVYGSVVGGVVAVLFVVCLGVLFVVIKKYRSRGPKKGRMVIPDKDVFSLEDNDEWEL